jgi:hypothetical protein
MRPFCPTSHRIEGGVSGRRGSTGWKTRSVEHGTADSGLARSSLSASVCVFLPTKLVWEELVCLSAPDGLRMRIRRRIQFGRLVAMCGFGGGARCRWLAGRRDYVSRPQTSTSALLSATDPGFGSVVFVCARERTRSGFCFSRLPATAE